MIWGEDGDLRYISFESLRNAGVMNRIYTRLGGVSPDPWNSLNLGGTNGDKRENVILNRKKIFESIGRRVESIFDVWQVHGNEIICAQQPRNLFSRHQKADGIITNKLEITLLMRFADCVPIYLFDPVRRVVGLVHAGWMGTVNKAGAAAINAMKIFYQCQPKDLVAVIGPSIGPDHYEVGRDVVDRAGSAFGGNVNEIILQKESKTYMDLWRANEITLLEAGVVHVEKSSVCTACDTRHWYSHRGENGKTGRFAAVIGLDG